MAHSVARQASIITEVKSDGKVVTIEAFLKLIHIKY